MKIWETKIKPCKICKKDMEYQSDNKTTCDICRMEKMRIYMRKNQKRYQDTSHYKKT